MLMKVQNKPAHIACAKEDIAKTVLMPGDPLRARYIAEHYLENARLVTNVRNMLGYTGTYKGKRVTVMGSGMGIPSMGIYAYELYHFFDVEEIIRIGTCGNVMNPDIQLMDIVVADSSYSESNFAFQLYNNPDRLIKADEGLTEKICQTMDAKQIPYQKGTICTTECFDFYMKDLNGMIERLPKDIPFVACEMESFALFHVANYFGKKAACLATVVDSAFTDDFIEPSVREKSVDQMIQIALDSII